MSLLFLLKVWLFLCHVFPSQQRPHQPQDHGTVLPYYKGTAIDFILKYGEEFDLFEPFRDYILLTKSTTEKRMRFSEEYSLRSNARSSPISFYSEEVVRKSDYLFDSYLLSLVENNDKNSIDGVPNEKYYTTGSTLPKHILSINELYRFGTRAIDRFLSVFVSRNMHNNTDSISKMKKKTPVYGKKF